MSVSGGCFIVPFLNPTRFAGRLCTPCQSCSDWYGYEGIWVGPDSNIPNTRGMRNDVVAALKALKVPNVRWPGGCFADEYHWRKGIGPQRVVTLNPNWGSVIEPNTFGTHEFMDFLDLIGVQTQFAPRLARLQSRYEANRP